MYPHIVPCLSAMVSRFAGVYRFFFVRPPQLEVKRYPRVSHYLTTMALRTPLRLVKETEIPPWLLEHSASKSCLFAPFWIPYPNCSPKIPSPSVGWR